MELLRRAHVHTTRIIVVLGLVAVPTLVSGEGLIWEEDRVQITPININCHIGLFQKNSYYIHNREPLNDSTAIQTGSIDKFQEQGALLPASCKPVRDQKPLPG